MTIAALPRASSDDQWRPARAPHPLETHVRSLRSGRAPIGSLISDALPEITNWIIDVPNNAGRRAILIGAALGAIVTGLRVLLGMERQHVGGD